MNAETFCEQFATFAEAPNGVAKLRELILQLAVQGKLVPQCDNDGDGKELQRKLESLRWKQESMLRRNKEGVATPEFKWNVPSKWGFTTLESSTRGDDGIFADGDWVESKDQDPTGGVRLIQLADVGDGIYRDRSDRFMNAETAARLNCSFLCVGDVLLARMPDPLGRACVFPGDPKRAVTVVDVCIVRVNTKFFLPDFVVIAINSGIFRDAVAEKATGTTRQRISRGNLASFPVPFPPLAEQQRIVEKVDQLLGMCDELAARQATRREARSALVGATLDRLVSARSAAEFPTHAHRLRDHFDLLFDTPTTIPQLRQAILQLAVQGQLVPQDPNDEPAIELLARVDSEKIRLEELGEFKTQPPMSPLADREVLFPIPTTWKWVRAAELSYPISSGSTPAKSVFQSSPEGGVPYLKVYNIRGQKIDFDYCPQYIDHTHHASKMKRSLLVPGMVVLNIVGPPLGKTAVIPATFPEWNCNQAIAFFRFIGDVLPEFVHIYFKTGTFLKNIALIGTAGQDNISVTKCKNIVIPLPPFAEQKRIVSKVTELLSVCDALEAKLKQAESASTQLLSAAVHQLLI